MYDSKIHTIMDTLELNNYELSYIEHPVHQLELSGVPLTPEILEKNGWKDDGYDWYGGVGMNCRQKKDLGGYPDWKSAVVE